MSSYPTKTKCYYTDFYHCPFLCSDTFVIIECVDVVSLFYLVIESKSKSL